MASYEVNKRILGSSIPKEIQDKLNLRQNLSKEKLPNESLEEIAYKSNFEGSNDLSSRTPFARLWTAVEAIQLDNDGDKTPLGQRVYSIGNNIFNNLTAKPNDSIQGPPSQRDSKLSGIFPKKYELDGNKFFDAPAGIKSVTSQTEGLGAVKRTSVNFRVFNYADYENIYLKYFLKPGAQMFVDFGWDLNSLYNPESLVSDPDGINENLYGPDGFVTKSNGDLETLYGVVTNYTSKAQDDGSVDISLEILSSGTALISKNMSKGDAARIRRRISFGLDLTIMKHLEELGYVNNIDYDGSVTKDYNQSEQFARKARAAGLATPLSRESQSYDKNERDAASSEFKFPSRESVEAGVFFSTKDKVVTESSMFISYGLFEDLILNKEFGFGLSNIDDVLDGENSLRFDSSTQFVRWNKNLSLRQKNATDVTSLSYLYPDSWQKSYNSIIGKVPDYPSKRAEYQSILKDKGIKTTTSKPMTDQQKRESILQYECLQSQIKMGGNYCYQTIDDRFTIQSDGNLKWNRPHFRTKGDPYCIALEGSTSGISVGNAYDPVGQVGPPSHYTDCSQHGDQDVNGGYDYFVQSVNYLGSLDEKGLSNGDLKPISKDENLANTTGFQYYDSSYQGETFEFKAYRTINGLQKGVTYTGGDSGVIYEENETNNPEDIDNQSLDEALGRIPVRDLFISVATIKKAFINNSNLIDALKEIYKQINDDSGEIIDLFISSADYSQTKMCAVDRNYVESQLDTKSTKYFTFNINNRSTLVKSYDLTYTIPTDDISSVVAINAMADEEMTPTDMTIESILDDKLLNKGDDNNILVKYIPDVGSYQAKQIKSYTMDDNIDDTEGVNSFGSDVDQKNKSKNLYGLLKKGKTQSQYNAVDFKTVKTPNPPKNNETVGSDDTEISALKTSDKITQLENLTDKKVHVDGTEEFYLQRAKNEYFYTIGSALLPFEITLNIYGISSLVVGDTFQINYLPKKYRDRTFFQITGITHNIENTGWSTELTSKMRMKSQVKLEASVIKNTIVTREEADPVISVKKQFIINRKNISNFKILDLGIKNFKDMIPIERNFKDAYVSSLNGGDVFKFTWDGPEKQFEACKVVIAASDSKITPGFQFAHDAWNTILKNKDFLLRNNPNLTFTTYGDLAPPKSVNDSPGYGGNYINNDSQKINAHTGTVDGFHNLKGMLAVEGGLVEYLTSDKLDQRRTGDYHKYWVVEYKTKLVSGQQYVVYTSQGQTETAIFPLVTEDVALHNVLPYLYPKNGIQIHTSEASFNPNLYYNQYINGDSIIEDTPPVDTPASPPL